MKINLKFARRILEIVRKKYLASTLLTGGAIVVHMDQSESIHDISFLNSKTRTTSTRQNIRNKNAEFDAKHESLRGKLTPLPPPSSLLFEQTRVIDFALFTQP